jgi:hypothetical protein
MLDSQVYAITPRFRVVRKQTTMLGFSPEVYALAFMPINKKISQKLIPHLMQEYIFDLQNCYPRLLSPA